MSKECCPCGNKKRSELLVCNACWKSAPRWIRAKFDSENHFFTLELLTHAKARNYRLPDTKLALP